MVATDDRGQAFTLEAITAAIVLLAAVVFVIQATSVTPQAATTSNQQSMTQLAHVGSGLLDGAAANDMLRPTVLYWNVTNRSFYGADEPGGYYTTGPPTAFGRLLNRTFDAHGVPYNVHLHYLTPNGERRTRRLVHSGTPSDDAVRVTITVTLYDDDRLLTRNGRPSNRTVSNATAFYAPDIAPNSGLYNVVVVEVVLWST